jgi:hypothetical protein
LFHVAPATAPVICSARNARLDPSLRLAVAGLRQTEARVRRLGGDVASIEAELDGRQRTMSKTNRGPIRRTIGPIFALALIAAGAFVVIALLFFAPGFRVGWLLGGFAMLFGGLCWAMGRLHQR